MKPGYLKLTTSLNEEPTPMGPQHDACRPIHELLNLVGDKWTMQVVRRLGNGRMRFNELRRTIEGISQKMLTTTLRNLERDGFVNRTIYPTIPPKVEYDLTELGHELLVPVSALGEWVYENRYRIEAARQEFDRQQGKRAGS